MAGDKYFISDQHAPYFITSTVIHWIDLFTRQIYRDIIVDSLNYCVTNKGLELYGWVIMSNHIHLLGLCHPPHGMSGFLRDFKKHTSKEFIKAIDTERESRKVWLRDKFHFEALRTKRALEYKVWKDDNHAILMTRYNAIPKLDYIHNNPVRAGLVTEPDHYLYSSARDYAGKKGLVKITKK